MCAFAPNVIVLIISRMFVGMAVGIVNTDSIKEQIAVTGGNYTAYMALIALLVASTLFVTMLISRMVGCSLPFLAKLVKLDPAVMCGPITTTLVDIISLVTYFLLWTEVIGPAIGF